MAAIERTAYPRFKRSPTQQHLHVLCTPTASENSASDEQAGLRVRKLLAERGPADQLLEECEKVVAYSSDNYQSSLWRCYRNDRGAIFQLIRNLRLGSTSQDQSVINALNYLLENENRRGDWLPDEVDLSFASARWLRTIYGLHKGELMLNRRHFEVSVFTYLAAELKTGDISIAESDEYGDYRELLLLWNECETSVADYCRELDLPGTAEDFVAQLKQWLTETAQRVDEGYPKNGQLVIDEQGQPRLKKLPAAEERASTVALRLRD